jgi:hypothetical protein
MRGYKGVVRCATLLALAEQEFVVTFGDIAIGGIRPLALLASVFHYLRSDPSRAKGPHDHLPWSKTNRAARSEVAVDTTV